MPGRESAGNGIKVDRKEERLMKKVLVMMVALLTVVAFASVGMAAEKKTAAKPKTAQALKVSGKVVAYEPGKLLKVKGAKSKEWAFDIAPDVNIKGDVKEGVNVKVDYRKDGAKLVATKIAVIPEKSKAQQKPKKK
jgi:hypothetical protein